jgi:SAM-dependent methyltransferase
MTDDRLYAPATGRNRAAILDVLRAALPSKGHVLEIASGSGEHVVHFARALPLLTFQPTDLNAAARRSIAAWVEAEGLTNVEAPIALDAMSATWPVTAADAVLCINMIHIAPWSAAEGLIAGAASILPPDGVLYLYGPYRRGGAHTAPSNEAFDRDLRGRDPAWGVRDLEAVAALAERAGFGEPAITPMPANNLSLVFRRL